MTEHHPALGHFKHRIVPILDRTGAPAQAAPDGGRQHLRFLTQAAFFILFILAPVFDLLRYDLVAGHAWFLGMEWHVGLDDYSAGRIGLAELSAHIGLRIFLPILGTGAALLIVAWRWGRLYCGWLCPHFSVVETINRLMRRATGKPSLWERKTLPPRQPDGRAIRSDRRWWLVTVPLAVGFAFVWTVVLSIEFLFARHLFCRYACAVGLFQSLAWMGNRKAMVVGFERERAADCASCWSACDHACPMRLKPRNYKAAMFTCTQCAQCISACETTQRDNPAGPLLAWVAGEAAKAGESDRKSTR